MLPSVPNVGPAVPATFPPFDSHSVTAFTSLAMSIAKTPFAAEPQPSRVATYRMVSIRMDPTAFAFGGRNLTGGVRSSPVWGFSVCSRPPLDTA